MIGIIGGDPNGTRTRVFAVKSNLPLKSTALPQFRGLFLPLQINGLGAVGEILEARHVR